MKSNLNIALFSCLMMLLALGKSTLSSTIKIQAINKGKVVLNNEINSPFCNNIIDMEHEDESNHPIKLKLNKAINSGDFFSSRFRDLPFSPHLSRAKNNLVVSLDFLCVYRI
ncbi:MAG: hypothetical protein ACK5QC_08330 [Bacteroidota bacterium]|nr:hypothetical protein [Bacteroidota bacterium]MCA6442659.1 hypothetical protein [Bacteroidota bacterium]